MVLFGQNPSQGTLLKGSQFLAGTCCRTPDKPELILYSAEELPVRLAHRVKELDELPHNISKMPSIIKVKNWYAQSFEVRSPSHEETLSHTRHRNSSHSQSPDYPKRFVRR